MPTINVRPRTLTRLRLVALGAGGLLALTALAACPHAKADTVATDYTTRHGLQVCAAIDANRTDAGVDRVLTAMFADGLSGDQAGTVLFLSYSVFCPWNENAVQHWANQVEGQPVASGGSVGGAYRA